MKRQVRRALIVEALRQHAGTGNIISTYRVIAKGGNDQEIDAVIRELYDQIRQTQRASKERSDYIRKELLGDRLYQLIKFYPYE